MDPPLHSAVISMVDRQHYFRGGGRFSNGAAPFPSLKTTYPGPFVFLVEGPFPCAVDLSAPTGKRKPLTGYNVLLTSPGRVFHLWLQRGRATPIPVDVFLSSLRCTPRHIDRSGWDGGPPGETELSYADPGIYGSLLCHVRRSAETMDLLKGGVLIHLLAPRMWGRHPACGAGFGA